MVELSRDKKGWPRKNGAGRVPRTAKLNPIEQQGLLVLRLRSAWRRELEFGIVKAGLEVVRIIEGRFQNIFIYPLVLFSLLCL